jgi:hypothetical protein
VALADCGLFRCRNEAENGTTAVTEADGTTSQVAIYSNGNAGMVVYPFAERLAMANNIEGAIIERYGVDQGTENAICSTGHAGCGTRRADPFGVKRWQSYTITSLPIWMKTAGLKCQRRTEGAT